MMRIVLFLATNFAILLVASVTLSLLGIGTTDGAGGINLTGMLIFCALFGFGGAFVSLFLSKWMAKRGTGARVIETPQNRQEQWLVDTVAQLAKQANIGMPEVAIFPSRAPNAFATGWNRNASLVAVSEGMLQRFSPNEVKAVMAHEIGHVANGDMVTLTLIQGVVNTFVMFFARIIGSFVDRVIFKNESGGIGFGYIIATIFAEIILGILASLIVMWFSRQREFRADAAAAQLAGAGNMIAALEHLRAEQGIPVEMPGEMVAFGINGSLKNGLAGLLMTHPPLEQRIAALRAGNFR
ncbi:protease HtpX [Halopseudomonas laoshanensis]|uniref:Protease HtpX n=1 Tax=Halopseudomonas laoshanensis TaxID=2268758 RepID=A0A7V7KY55_9GAMM|nr:protease HtpX [Halopseudomonas laoshanensis]KAA0696402.1 protease HtpX [Halopseudomonas laoshanensis]WOD09785.1 protease HtpX [Pseudomonas sp. NyZ704]